MVRDGTNSHVVGAMIGVACVTGICDHGFCWCVTVVGVAQAFFEKEFIFCMYTLCTCVYFIVAVIIWWILHS